MKGDSKPPLARDIYKFTQLEHPPSVNNHEEKAVRMPANDGNDLLSGVFYLGHHLINPRHQQ